MLGISSASYYPLETEKAFLKVCESGAPVTEIFFNSISELSDTFIDSLCEIRRQYGIKIASLHPTASFAEPFLLFSEYRRRFYDTLELYKKYFFAAEKLDSHILVMHGGSLKTKLSVDEYCERFALLRNAGLKYGVSVTQENVNGYLSQNPAFIKQMRKNISDIKFTFDVKQAVRAGFSPYEMIDAMGDAIINVHLSDNTADNDCLLPGNGTFDFKKLFLYLKNKEYSGDYLIEVYRNAYIKYSEISDSLEKIKIISL